MEVHTIEKILLGKYESILRNEQSEKTTVLMNLVDAYRSMELDEVKFKAIEIIESQETSDYYLLAQYYYFHAKVMLGETVPEIELEIFVENWRQMPEPVKNRLRALVGTLYIKQIQKGISVNELKQLVKDFFPKLKFRNLEFEQYYLSIRYFHEAKIFEKQGIFNKALSKMTKALKSATTPLNFHIIQKNIAIIHAKMGKLSKATKILAEILKHCNTPAFSYLKAQVFNNLTILSMNQSNYEQARHFGKYCTEISNKYGFSALKDIVLYNLANNLSDQGDYNNAILIYQELAKSHLKSGNLEKYYLNLNGLASCASQSGQLQVAFDTYELIFEQDTAKIPQDQYVTLLYNFADTALVLGKLDTADKYIKKLVKTVNDNKSQQVLLNLIQLKNSVFTDNYQTIDAKKFNEINQFLSYESKYKLLSIVKYYQSKWLFVNGEYIKACLTIDQALEHARFTNHPVDHTRFLFWKLVLKIRGAEIEELNEIEKEMKSIMVKHRYPVLQQIYTITEFIIQTFKVITSDKSLHSVNGIDFEGINSYLMDDKNSNFNLTKDLIMYLMDLVSSSNIPSFQHLEDFLLQKFEYIANVRGSTYLQTYLFYIRGKLHLRDGNEDQAQIYLKHAKEMAISYNYSDHMNLITSLEIQTSKIMNEIN